MLFESCRSEILRLTNLYTRLLNVAWKETIAGFAERRGLTNRRCVDEDRASPDVADSLFGGSSIREVARVCVPES